MPDADMSMLSGTTSPATSQPSTSWHQSYGHATMPAPTLGITHPLPPAAPALRSAMTTYHVNAPPQLPDISEVVHARVTQHLQGALDPFLLADEDSQRCGDFSRQEKEEDYQVG